METSTHNPRVARRHDLDNIRSLIIVFVVLFHAMLPYSQACPWWYVIDPQPIPQAIYILIFLEPLLMPVLFLISGLLAWPSYTRKGPARFMADKNRRLVVPFLLCTLLFSPIMPFIRQLLRSASSGSDPLGFWDFWLKFLKSGSEIQGGHVGRTPDLVVSQYWFLMLLFLFFAGFCLYNMMRGGKAVEDADHRPAEPPSRTALLGLIALFGLVVGLAYTLVCTFIDGTVWVTVGSLLQVQPAKVPIYLAFFLAGIHMGRRNWLPCLLGIARPTVWFVVGVLITAAYLFCVLMTFPTEEPSQALFFASRFLRIFFVLAMTLWFLSLFHNRFNQSTMPWRELSRNSYNIYLIHMVPQVVLQLLARTWSMPAPLKFAGVSLLTLLFSYLVSRFLVRKSTRGTILSLVILFAVMCLIFR